MKVYLVALIRILVCLSVLVVASCAPKKNSPAPDADSLRGVWVQWKSVLTADDIDEVIRRTDKGGFKEIFVGVFGNGTTIFPSKFAPQTEDVEPGFDPLA